MALSGQEGYCVKCKAKKTMDNAEEITMKNGRPAVQGTCPDCSTKIFRIGKPSA
jgi:DNA-directed RNA polymerase subunit RPC12/RpoP